MENNDETLNNDSFSITENEPEEETTTFAFGANKPETFTNEYEDSIDGSLARLSSTFGEQNFNIRASNIENGLATDPIKYGKAKRIAERRNTDVDLVFDNFEEFEKKDKELLLAEIVDKSPALKELATDDPEFMKLAANDCDKLKEISDNLTIYGEMEKPIAPVAWVKKASYIYNEQEERLDTFEEIGDLMTKDDPESQARLALLVDKANQNPLVDTSDWSDIGYNFIEQLPYQKRTTLPLFGAMVTGAVADAAISAKVGAAGGAAAGAVATPAGSAAGATVGAAGGAVVGTIKGATIGYAAGNVIAFKNTYDVETGAMYANLAVMKDENGKGFDREDMVAASRIYGGISAAIELVPANTLVRVFPWYQEAKKGLLKAGLKKSIMESVKNKTVMQVWGNVLKSVTASVVTETGEEILQETAQIIGERALKGSYNDKVGYEFKQNDIEDDTSRVAQAGVQGFKASLMLPALGGAWRGRVETKAVREVQAIDALQKGDEAKAQLDIARLDKTQAQIEQLGELKENPDKMQSFFQKVSRKSDIRDIYMEAAEAKAILSSEAVTKNMDVMRRYGLIESIERQLSLAQTDDAPIKIPFDVWGSTVMTKQELWGAFRDVVKTYEDGTTMKQLIQNQKIRSNILADGKKIAEENQLDFDYIYRGLYEDAAAAGYSREQAKEAATQNAYFYLGLARAAGQNAVDIYRQDRLQFNYSVDGKQTRSAELDNIMDVIREEQLSNADANLVRASRAIARRDVNAIKKILMKKIENPTAGDVREYIRLFNAVSDMRLKLDGMSNEDFATALQEYMAQSPVTVDIKRTDADRIKSGIFSASETALKDIQADGATQDYVAVAGGRVPVNYEIVELSDLITSHNTDGMINEAYPQALQPRDRSRSASDAQITEIVNRFEPARVGKAPTATEGAPIVTKEGYVAVGNGRAMALNRVYETSDKSQAYKDYLTSQGYNIEGFAEPVLIRRLGVDLNEEQLSALVDDANTAGTMQYSDAEKAIAYSKKLNSNIINLLDTDAELESAANSKFIRAFFAEVVPTGERNAFLDKDDRVTRKGIEMIENTLVSIIVPDTRFLSVLVENPDNNIRKVTSGLAKAAPNIVAFENDIQGGLIAPEYSIAQTVRQAVEILKRAKDKGQATALYVQQLDMLEGQIAPDVLAMVDLFDNTKSAQDFNDKIKNYIRNATEQGDTKQDNMFGMEPISKTELLEREAKQMALFQKERDNLTGDLFAQPANAQGKPLPVSVKKQVDDLFSYAEKQEGVTKELPLFSLSGESKKIEKTYQSSKQIVDAGDSLLGNLKRNAKVYTWEELEGMNDLLRRKYVTKTYIYPRLTIDDLRGRGIDGRAAALVEYIYNALNVKPAKNVNDTLANQKRFFDVIHRTMETVIEYAKAHKAEIEAWQTDMGFNYDLFRAVFPSGETNPRLVFSMNKEYNTEALVAGGNKFLSALMISGYDLAKLDAIAKDFDKQIEEKDNSKANVEPWQKHFMVVKRAYQDSWFVVDSNGKSISRDLSFATQEKAAEFAQKAYELVKPYLKGQGETVDFSGMRTGLPRRQNNQNVNPEALMETFGFRGVNFGNWTKQSERQEFLNLTYDSLLDMTEILGIPPKAIGLEGKLGLAFGAQGRAGAAGHFMPEFNEINLTRKDGAGSLAHEWWHALDYYFGDQSLGKDYSGHAVLELEKQGNLRSETYEAIRNLYQQIATADMNDKEVEDRYKAQVSRTEFMINNRANEIKNKFARAKNSEQINKFIDDMVAQGKNYDASKDEKYLSDFQNMIEERRRTADLAGLFFDLQYRLRQLVKLDDNTSSWRKVSKYYNTAVKLNRVTKKKNGYWTQHTELGARAFASYINDKVASNGWYNYFLAGHAKLGVLDEYSYLEALIDAEKTGKKADINDYMLPVYPADEAERANINAAFDRLFNTIEVDENNNFRLYQNENYEALGAYSPSNLTITLFKNNNMTTLIHESGHFWRDMIRKYAAKEGATDKLKEYSETLENWLSDEWSKHNEIVPMDDGTYRLIYNGEDDGQVFASFDDALEVAKHECFARAVEKYFYTADAPTYGLRKVFAAFKKWLATKYKDAVDKFNVDITPEVKDVFDRLLATDGEIEQYAMEKRIQAIFDTPDAAKMSEKQFENYQTYVDNMLTIAKDDYYKAVAKTVYKEQSDEFKRKLDEIRQDVLLDYTVGSDANRFIGALVYGRLGNGDIDVSLNQAEMEAIFNAKVANGIARLPKRPDGSNIYTADGSTLKELGEFFNLDETEMKTALSTSPRLINSIEQAAKYKAHEELGNPISYADVEAQVMKSIANEKYESLLTTELSKLSTNPESKNIMAHALIMQAEDEIGKLNVDEIKPDEYFNASLKYGDKALIALNKGNKKAALAYKQQQLKQFYLYKEALRQADYVKKAINRLKEIGKQEVNNGVNQQHQDAARAILARYNLAAVLTQQQKERFENIGRWIDEQRAAGYDIDIPDSFLQTINRRDWQELTVDELGILFEGVKNIIHNGREIKEYELAGKQLDKEKTIERLREQLGKTYKLDLKERTGKQEKHAIKDLFDTIDTNIITAGGLAERIDNADINGVMHDVVLRPLADGQNIENDLLARYGKRLNELNKSLPKDVQAQMFENVDGAKEALGANYTRAELISIALNMGNWYNLQRLKDGNGFKDNQLAWVTNKLSAAEWDYIQNVWDLLDSMYPMLEEHQKKMSGLDMDKVFPMPVITPYGKYRGGYFPIVYDLTAERKAQEANSANTALLDGDYGRATTSKGYTKSRKDIVRAMPLKLGLGIISQHIATVIHDVAYRQIIRQQWNFLNDSEVVGIFDSFGLDKYRDGLIDLLRKIANQPNRDARAAKELEGYLRVLRNRTTVMGLGFRLSTAMSQLMGYTASIAAMSQRGRKNGAKHGGTYWLMQGVKAFLRSKQNREWAIANSHELRTRLNNNDVNVAEAMKGVAQPKTTRQTLEAALTKGGFWLIGKMDFVVAQTTWFAAYQQARKDMGKNHQDAVFYADRVMLDSQGSGNLKDTTLFQRGGEVKKSMALFFSPFAGLYQLWTQAAKDIKDKRDFKGAVQDMFTMFCLSAWMEGIIKGDLPKDDDDEALEWVKFFLVNPIFYWMSTIPILRDMAGFMEYGRAQPTIYTKAAQVAYEPVNDIRKAAMGKTVEANKFIKDLMNAIAMGTGVPVGGQVADYTDYYTGLMLDNKQADSLGDILYGLYRGKERK